MNAQELLLRLEVLNSQLVKQIDGSKPKEPVPEPEPAEEPAEDPPPKKGKGKGKGKG